MTERRLRDLRRIAIRRVAVPATVQRMDQTNQDCCQMLPEFEDLFDPTDPTFIGTVLQKYADEALDLFLTSEVDHTMANDLETYRGGCIKEDQQTSGVHVLCYVQRRFAPVDDIDEQVEARRNL